MTTGGTWEETVSLLEGALRRLPLQTPSADAEGIAHERYIPDIARDLLQLCFREEWPLGPEFNRLKSASAKVTASEIKAVKEGAQHLLKALETLHAPAYDAIAFPPIEMAILTGKLSALATAASNAPIPHQADIGGRPKKFTARAVARSAAFHYHALTGKAPAPINGNCGPAHGPFLDFLAEVFEILGIKASAESQAKEARKWLEALKSGSTSRTIPWGENLWE